MWVPTSAVELEVAALGGDLEETHIFEAKRELPKPKRNVDIAIDVCAMTVDGGVVVWGVGEDEHGVPNVPAPLELKDQPERVEQIIRTSISEVPFVRLSGCRWRAIPRSAISSPSSRRPGARRIR